MRTSNDRPHAESLATNVVETVAARRGVDPTTLPSLNDAVDTDALDALFAPLFDGTPRVDDDSHPGGWVRFRYAGYQVTVTADGSVDLS